MLTSVTRESSMKEKGTQSLRKANGQKNPEYEIRDRSFSTVMDRAESDPLTYGLYETSPKAEAGNRMAYTPYSFLRQWLLPSKWLCFVSAVERKDGVFCL